MNGATIIMGTITGGGAIMIGSLLLLIALFVAVRWLMERRGV